MQKAIKFTLIGLLLGLVLYVVVYLMASHGDAFKYVDQRIRTSAMIESKFGYIKNVRLDPLGSYEKKSIGSDEWVTMKVEVAGAKTTVILDVRVRKTNGNWTIEQVIGPDTLLVLD
jgi:hypothetical protein